MNFNHPTKELLWIIGIDNPKFTYNYDLSRSFRDLSTKKILELFRNPLIDFTYHNNEFLRNTFIYKPKNYGRIANTLLKKSKVFYLYEKQRKNLFFPISIDDYIIMQTKNCVEIIKSLNKYIIDDILIEILKFIIPFPDEEIIKIFYNGCSEIVERFM